MGKKEKVEDTQKTEPVEDAEVLEDKEFEEVSQNGEDIDEDSVLSLEGLVEELKNQNVKLSDENTKFQNELDALKDRLLRLNAEYDNYRKRTAKEKESIYTDACEDVLTGILPVKDNLERALGATGNVEDIKKGVEITLRQFNVSLEKLQVEEISTENSFDPNFHNAIAHIEDEQYGEGQIVEVFQKGYKRGDKVLRHSLVKVAN